MEYCFNIVTPQPITKLLLAASSLGLWGADPDGCGHLSPCHLSNLGRKCLRPEYTYASSGRHDSVLGYLQVDDESSSSRIIQPAKLVKAHTISIIPVVQIGLNVLSTYPYKRKLRQRQDHLLWTVSVWQPLLDCASTRTRTQPSAAFGMRYADASKRCRSRPYACVFVCYSAALLMDLACASSPCIIDTADMLPTGTTAENFALSDLTVSIQSLLVSRSRSLIDGVP